MPRGISTLAGPKAQRILAGIGDQALVAVTSAGLILVATAVLPRSEVVGTLYATQIIVFLQGVGRALIGDILLTFAARIDDEPARRRQFDNAHAMALALSLIGMIACGLGILCLPDLFPRDLLWGLPLIPAILLQDLARYTYQTEGQQAKALVIDLAWVTVEIIGLVGVIATGLAGDGRILTCWGLAPPSEPVSSTPAPGSTRCAAALWRGCVTPGTFWAGTRRPVCSPRRRPCSSAPWFRDSSPRVPTPGSASCRCWCSSRPRVSPWH